MEVQTKEFQCRQEAFPCSLFTKPNWFWFLFIFPTRDIDVKFGAYGTERSRDCCHSQRWHCELGTQWHTGPSQLQLFTVFSKRNTAKKSQEGDSFWSPAVSNTSLQFWYRACLSKDWHESKRADPETHRWQNPRVKRALQSPALWKAAKEIVGSTVTDFLFFPFFFQSLSYSALKLRSGFSF